MADAEVWKYGYCEDADCAAVRFAHVTPKRAQWKHDGVPVCTDCLRRRQRAAAS